MMRPLMLILVGLSLTGCKSQAPTNDPFFGRTTIPPPPTGSATGRFADPYYQTPPLTQTPPQMPAAASPPLVQMPAQTPAGSSTYQPPTSPQLPPYQPPAAAATTTPSVSPPGLAPNVSAPRPTSTAPGSSLPARPTWVAPPAGAAGPYAPPGGSLNYRGTSTQGSAPLVPTQPDTRTSLPSIAGFSPARTITVSEDRTPKPVEDAPADGSVGGRNPMIQTIQPRPRDGASDRLIDIMDLPAAGSPGLETKPLRPTGP